MAASLESRVSQHDKEIAAIRKLVQTGMKMLVKIEGDIVKLGQDMRQLAASQKETDRMLKGLIRSLERGPNGKG